MRPLLAALVVIGFSGCGQGVSPVVEAPMGTAPVSEPAATTRERLELDTTEFRIHPTRSIGSFTSRRVLAEASSTVPLALADGAFEAYAYSDETGPRLAVTRLSASLEDVRFSEVQLPPNGLTLTRVSFAMAEPARLFVRWFGDGSLGWAKGSITVDIHTWLRLSNGAESQLEVARLEVPVELSVSQTANGLLGLWLQVARDGPLWNWAGLFELSDLTLSLEAFEVGPVAQLPPLVVLN